MKWVLLKFGLNFSENREVHPVRLPSALRRSEHDLRGFNFPLRHRSRRLCPRWNVRRFCWGMGGKQTGKVISPKFLISGPRKIKVSCQFFFRKGGLLLNNFVGIVGATAMGLSQLAESYELLIVGRYLIGVNCGKSFTLELIQSASSQVRTEPNWAYSNVRKK